MACFLVPAAEAAVTTVISKAVEKAEEKKALTEYIVHDSETCTSEDAPAAKRQERSLGRTFLHRLNWLSEMLWGGAVLLLFEHIWHGEVVPWPPFLTAASDPAATADMLHEMATAGVSMAVLVTAVWAGMVMISAALERRAAAEAASAREESK